MEGAGLSKGHELCRALGQEMGRAGLMGRKFKPGESGNPDGWNSGRLV